MAGGKEKKLTLRDRFFIDMLRRKVMELLSTLSISAAKNKIEQHFKDFKLTVEDIPLTEALDRILSKDITALDNVPDFNRSTVDGYALISKDTIGASETLPGFLEVIGSVEMGQGADLSLKSGQCCYVPTGGMLPMGADGVVMVEYTELLDEKTVCIQRPVAPLENILSRGDDIREGQMIFKKGHRLRSQDIGALAGMGFNRVQVYQRLRVSIISTGDELLAPEEELTPGKIRDMNTYSLAAAAQKDGCQIVSTAVVGDQFDLLRNHLQEVLPQSDVVLISGGSSMGVKDITKDVINSLGEPGVFIHGLAVKPGKPTIAAKLQDKAVFGLPGQPVSALVIYHVIVGEFIKRIQGQAPENPYMMGEITVNIPSAAGKEHYVMVTLSREGSKLMVNPVYGKSGMLSMMTKAIGYICIGQNQEGIYRGDSVKVYLF